MCASVSAERFTLTLCLGSVRTLDAQTFAVRNRPGEEGRRGAAEDGSETTVMMGSETVAVNSVVPRALPSRVAAAVLAAIDSTPSGAHSMHVLLGAPLHGGSSGSGAPLGNAVVENLLQAQHMSNREDARLFFDECLVFATLATPKAGLTNVLGEEDAVCCETVAATDSWETIQRDILSHLTNISMVVFKYSDGRSATVLVAPRLTTPHIAALALTPRRAVYLYVDSGSTSRDVANSVREMHVLRDSLGEFFRPLSGAVPATPAMAPLLRYRPPAVETSVSRALDAVAHSDEEYSAVNSAAEQDLRLKLAQSQADCARLQDILSEERATSRLELEAVRHQQRESSRANASSMAEEEREVQHLRAELAEANRGRQFAEEKIRLLEFKHSLQEDSSRSTLGRSISINRSASPTQAAPRGHSSALESETLALAQEFQQREHQLQLRLSEGAAELALAQAARREMESTLLLQSRTITEAKRVLAARGLTLGGGPLQELNSSSTSVSTSAPGGNRTVWSPSRGAREPLSSPSR